MNPEKSKVKIDTLENLGSSIDDNLENSQSELKLCEGAVQVLDIAFTKLDNFLHEIEKEVVSGQLSPSHALVAKKYSKRMTDFMFSFKESAYHKLFIVKGKVEAYDSIVKHIKKQYDEEKDKLSNFNTAVEKTKSLLSQSENESDENKQEKSSPPRLDVLRSLDIRGTKELKKSRKKT